MVIEGGVYRIDVRQGDNELWWGQWGDTLSDVILEVKANRITERSENSYGVMCRVRGTVGQEQAADPELAVMMEEESATPESEAPSDESQSAMTAEPIQSATSEPALPRSTAEGDGYLFLIQGTGQYGIFRASSRNLTPLVDWTSSAAIRQEPGENRLRAICVGDYLALYINDQFAADVTDNRYREGQVGLVASSANRLGVNVEFDDLVVFAGS
jgi:hypothetical protein